MDKRGGILLHTLTKEIQDRQAGDNTNATAISTHATNKSNPHGVTKEQVGLGNVDNTSDLDKPISTATQNALNLKADKSEISSLYRPKGSVATVNDLPTNAQVGDVYDVQSTGMNYVWTGTKWDELGAIIDLSPYYTKTEVDSALSGKVSKSGDTMTGNLTIQNASARELTLKNTSITKNYEKWKQVGIINGNASDGTIGQIEFLRNTPGGHLGSSIQLTSYNATGGAKYLVLYSFDDGVSQEAYVQHPSWKVGTNDNSDKSLTIKMANSLPSLCHSTGNETWSGTKTFTARPNINRATESGIIYNATDFDRDVTPTEIIRPWDCVMQAKGGVWFGRMTYYVDTNNKRVLSHEIYDTKGTSRLELVSKDGVRYATAPTTPTDATSNEIATANWVNDRFVKKSGDTMSGNLTVQSASAQFITKDTNYAVTDDLPNNYTYG